VSRWIAAAVAVCAFGATAVPADAAVPVQTRRVAEVNVLRAAKLIGRWDPGLVDRSTGLVRSNVHVRCTGTGRAREGRYSTFRCVVAGGRSRLVVRYVARPRGTCRLAKIRVYRV
jgi:hypothetical protein